MTCAKRQIIPKIVPQANIGHFLKIGRWRKGKPDKRS
jgi:hypothetical protein